MYCRYGTVPFYWLYVYIERSRALDSDTDSRIIFWEIPFGELWLTELPKSGSRSVDVARAKGIERSARREDNCMEH